MKKYVLSIAVVLCFIIVSATSSLAKDQTVCPVMGGKINKEIFADHEGNRVYFCCAMCIDTFKKDPDKYLKKMKEDSIEPTAVPSLKKTETGHEGHNH